MARKVKVSKWQSKILGPQFKAWLRTPEQVHGAPTADTEQKALDNLAGSDGVHPQNRGFVARAAAEGKGIEEK